MVTLQSISSRLSGLYSSALSSAGDAVISVGAAETNALSSAHADAKAAYDSTVGAVSSAAGTASEYLKILTVIIGIGVIAYFLAQVNLLRGK